MFCKTMFYGIVFGVWMSLASFVPYAHGQPSPTAPPNPKLVKLQFQVAVINLGYEADKYFTRYPGRFVSLHLVDWSAAEKKEVPVGQGSIDMKKLFAAAKIGGIQDYFLEMPLDLMKPGVPYLQQLTV